MSSTQPEFVAGKFCFNQILHTKYVGEGKHRYKNFIKMHSRSDHPMPLAQNSNYFPIFGAIGKIIAACFDSAGANDRSHNNHDLSSYAT